MQISSSDEDSEPSLTTKTQRYFAEIEVIKEEKACCNSKCCCYKSTCYFSMGLIGLIIEGLWIYSVVQFYIQQGIKIDYLKKMFPSIGKTYQRYIVQEFIVMAPAWIIILVKDYYGFRWLLKYRRRREFLAYYRLGITAYSSYILIDIALLLANEVGGDSSTV